MRTGGTCGAEHQASRWGQVDPARYRAKSHRHAFLRLEGDSWQAFGSTGWTRGTGRIRDATDSSSPSRRGDVTEGQGRPQVPGPGRRLPAAFQPGAETPG